jgi:hypothetical protein
VFRKVVTVCLRSSEQWRSVARQNFISVSVECTASNFKVWEQAKQTVSKKQEERLVIPWLTLHPWRWTQKISPKKNGALLKCRASHPRTYYSYYSQLILRRRWLIKFCVRSIYTKVIGVSVFNGVEERVTVKNIVALVCKHTSLYVLLTLRCV